MDESEFRLHAQLEDTHWWFCARREIIIDLFQRYLPGGKERHLVEIGCGTGGNLKALADYYNVSGVDMSAEAIRFASGRVSVPVVCGDFRSVLAGSWQNVDGILLADVLEHIEDDRNFLTDIVANLRPGAIVVITVPAFQFLWSRHDLVLGHVRRYRLDGLRALWSPLPVREHFASYFNSILFPIIALVRLIMGDGKEGKDDGSSLKPVNPILNGLLYSLFRFEKTLLRRVRLPFGVSLVAVLEKK